jgi:hypothetical protein
VRLKQRLKDAINNSKAIANLADNPLLLTMMTILNRRQELPRDRADLYDQASRVLLYHWDVDHKRLQLPMDAIGRREKQEMLRLIAYEMQAGDTGLKGNLIGVDRLTRILTNYLRDQGFSEPREKANQLIQQLRERNFILCYRGADTYGFVHRTFLEYFCALEIVNRFEKQQSISFEQLRDEIFGQHWQDKNWHEVLRLITGMLDISFTSEILSHLIDQEGGKRRNYINLLLSAECLLEIKNSSSLDQIYNKFIEKVLPPSQGFSWEISHFVEPFNLKITLTSNLSKVISIISKIWKDDPRTTSWLKSNLEFHVKSDQTENDTRAAALQELSRLESNNIEILSILKNCALFDRDISVRCVAVYELTINWKDDPDVITIIKSSSQCDDSTLANDAFFLRWVSLVMLTEYWGKEEGIFDFLCNCAISDPFVREQNDRHKFTNPRRVAIDQLARLYPEHSTTLEILKDRAERDSDWMVRYNSLQYLDRIWQGSTVEKFEFFYNRAIKDSFERIAAFDEDNPRQAALEALLNQNSTHPKTIALLHDRVLNDPDEQLREWAQQQLEQLGKT